MFAQVNDFRNWEAWSPWAKLDPAPKNSFEGAPAGKGAIFKWSGNNEVGEGSMTVTESRMICAAVGAIVILLLYRRVTIVGRLAVVLLTTEPGSPGESPILALAATWE